jgi:hypothetical protein
LETRFLNEKETGMLFEIIMMLLAGWGAGVVTGLIGASAVVVVAPILVTFLNYGAYEAIGVSLATDVVASLTAAHTYSRYGNIDLKSGIQMAISAIIGALVGSWASSYIPPATLGRSTGIVILVMGVSFIRKPITLRVKEFEENSDFLRFVISFFKKRRYMSSIFFGLLIGLICGIVGAGGGVMILLILMLILGYQIHVAIGTSVLIMAFTALSGAVGHTLYGHLPLYAALAGCIGGAIGAKSAATFANLASEEKLGRAVGVTFLVLGIIMTINEMIL